MHWVRLHALHITHGTNNIIFASGFKNKHGIGFYNYTLKALYTCTPTCLSLQHPLSPILVSDISFCLISSYKLQEKLTEYFCYNLGFIKDRLIKAGLQRAT